MDPTILDAGLETEAGIVALVIVVAQIIGRLIPDEATGILGVIRRVAKLVGLYTGNRETKDDPIIGLNPRVNQDRGNVPLGIDGPTDYES